MQLTGATAGPDIIADRFPAHPPVPDDRHILSDGVDRYVGNHLLIDLSGAQRTDDLRHVEDALRRCVAAASATLLNIYLHHFTPNGGISGVVVLAESHISIHSWPEREFAAIDMFMCGAAEPRNAIPVLQEAFAPSGIAVHEYRRGLGWV
ncbi:adenosylmethionine decarboxylase [Dactylosporangium aurantiacum]|uniref:Adenosylmethionine decarboxylase n=1 Tax=Dactylosporangium aurantiacum TaxID=35754 RepID=A0A9Q9IBI9_9ACTN|nr:adenosylmethionine decarboxylase [Dactylosporangium aurantiacum]MDG6107065.1 adenosylmethionine decarboxylase [Dactylosporangium aurantiacum]UWZ51365.1 adenosylmethionine decarboxylase [Dactylosporangium aurantiacum]